VFFLPKRSCAFRILAAAYVCGAALAVCAAQQTADTYPVKGEVLDSISHQPIARVLVETGIDAVLTDNDGHFELNLPAGEIGINLRRPGYGMRGQYMHHAIRVGANMPDLIFALTPEAMITGHVTLSTGDEADGIRITAYRRQVVNGRERWALQNIVTTNSEGAFRLANLEAPATYLLYSMPAHDRAGAIAPGAISYGYPSLYYPGVADSAAAGLITLSPGQQAQADFTLTQQPFYPVSIVMPGRRNGVQIHDQSGRTLEFSTRWNEQRGTAETNLPNGRYYAESRTPGESATYGRVEFTVAGGPVSGLSMAMAPLHPVPVIVRQEANTTESSGTGAGSVSLVSDSSPGLNLSLVSAEAFDLQAGGGSLRRPPGGSDSSLFELENAMPGRYWVETSPFRGYVSSITSGGVDLAREPLVIGAGNSTAPIEITLRNDAGTIAGQINQSTTAAAGSSQLGDAGNVFVYAIPLFPTTSQIPQSSTQGSGQFSIGNVAPGSYRVVAFDHTQEIDPTDTQALAKYIGKGQTATVEANGTANVQLDVIRAGDEGSTP
jgi:hypothetical protein